MPIINKIWSSPFGTMCSIPKIKYSTIVFPTVDCDLCDKRGDFSPGCK